MNSFVEHIAEDLLKIKSSKIKGILKEYKSGLAAKEEEQRDADYDLMQASLIPQIRKKPEPAKKKESAEELELSEIDLNEYFYEDTKHLSKEQTKAIMSKLKVFVTKLYKIYGSVYKLKKKESEFVHAIMMESGKLREENVKKYEKIKSKFLRVETCFFALKDFMNLKLEPFGQEDMSSEYKPSEDNKEMRFYSNEELEPLFDGYEEIALYINLKDPSGFNCDEVNANQLEEDQKFMVALKQLFEKFSKCIKVKSADQLLVKFFEKNNKISRKALVDVRKPTKKTFS